MYPECFFHLRCKNTNEQSKYYGKSFSHTLTIPSNWNLSWIWAKKALMKHSSLMLCVFSFHKKKTHAVAGIDYCKNIHYQKVVFTQEILSI